MRFITKLIIGALIFILCGTTLVTIVTNAKNKACQEIGYEEFSRIGNFNYCEKLDGDLHHIKWGYISFPHKVWVKEINVN